MDPVLSLGKYFLKYCNMSLWSYGLEARSYFFCTVIPCCSFVQSQIFKVSGRSNSGPSIEFWGNLF